MVAAHGVRHGWLTPSAAALRWSGMRFDGPVLHQPDGAGRIDGNQAVVALLAAAQGRGAQVRRPVTATSVEVWHDDLVHVQTSDGVIAAHRVVVTAGASSAQLLDGALALPPLRVTNEQSALFPFHDVPPCVASPGAWPTFHHHGPGVYGLADPCGDVRVALRGTATPDAPAQLRDYVATWLPGSTPRGRGPSSGPAPRHPTARS